MRSCRVFAGFVLAAMLCLTVDGADAQSIAGSGNDVVADSFPGGLETGVDDGLGFAEPAETRAGRVADVALSNLIFNDDFDGQENGGTSCASASVLGGDTTYSADTTAAPNWIGSFGPLFSPSNDVIYRFVAGPDVEGSITPTGSNYTFAMYLIASCRDSGAEPAPIGASATIGRGIDLAASGVISGHTYYLAITGASSGGAGANGILNFTTPVSLGAPLKP